MMYQGDVTAANAASAPPSRAKDDSTRGGYLLGHLLRFGRLLRLMGVETSLRQVLALAEALEYVSIANRVDFCCAARAMLVTRREDLLVFDQAFAIFWGHSESLPPGRQPTDQTKRARLPSQDQSQGSGHNLGLRGDLAADTGEDEASMLRTAYYSPVEIIRNKDFHEMSWEEIQAAKRAIAQLNWNLAQRRTRRYHAGAKGRLYLRRLVRDNLGHGGEILTLAYRTRSRRPRPLVVLCDISGSMERYSRMLLHFIHALTHGLTGVEVEAFVFSTQLTRITHHLRHKDVDESLNELGKGVKDWSGGTRIGEAIKTFNFRWARRVLGRGAVVLIISDGWDRGDSQLLAHEMARLQRSANRLMWLSPLLGAPGYEPTQRGLAAALAYVDDFLPGRNLASLEQLAEVLSSITPARPDRKQHPRPPSAAPEPKSRTRAGVNRSPRIKAAFPGYPLHIG